MNNDFVLRQVDNVLQDMKELLPFLEGGISGNSEPWQISAVFSKAKSAIIRITGEESAYYRDLEAAIAIVGSNHYRVSKSYGIVLALKSDIHNGFLKSLHEIIQSEVFSDYLDMAEHLNSQGYKDAAAVIAGSTLEAHLKNLAISVSIDVLLNGKPKKASQINDELSKGGFYTSAYQKQIIAWFGIRNDAAHGHYDKYSGEQVGLMIQGIKLFTLK